MQVFESVLEKYRGVPDDPLMEYDDETPVASFAAQIRESLAYYDRPVFLPTREQVEESLMKDLSQKMK